LYFGHSDFLIETCLRQAGTSISVGLLNRTGSGGGLLMPAMDDDDRPKKKVAHEIGQDLTLLSVKELDERVALLKEEIARLEADKVKKQAQRSAADEFFKR